MTMLAFPSCLQASARAPAIIFLDELDALVPARAARAGGSDQIYASGRGVVASVRTYAR